MEQLARTATYSCLLACLALSGCTTMDDRRSVEMRERAETDRIRVKVERLEERFQALESANSRTSEDVTRLESAVATSARVLGERVDGVSRAVAESEAARRRDREEMIQHLSKRMAEVLQSSRPAPSRRAERGYEHVVQPGETLSEIAAAYKVTIPAIVRANGLKNADSIRAGQTLFIPE